jgi:hypothetical protein
MCPAFPPTRSTLLFVSRQSIPSTRKRLRRSLSLPLLIGAGLAGASALSGCSSANGFFGQSPTVYTITVTATSGTLVHSTNITLTVE